MLPLWQQEGAKGTSFGGAGQVGRVPHQGREADGSADRMLGADRTEAPCMQAAGVGWRLERFWK